MEMSLMDRQRGVDCSAAAMDDDGARECHVDEPGPEKVERHLVGHSRRLRRDRAKHAEIVCRRLGEERRLVAGRAGDRLREGLEQIIERLGLPYVAYNMGSIVHLQTSGVLLLDTSNLYKLFKAKTQIDARKHMMEEMGAAYASAGLITLAGSRIYTSMADTDDVIDDALNRFEDVFKMV